MIAEQQRLQQDQERTHNWKRWGPYLSERQWATVREDYSAQGDSWNYLTHDSARSRAYRWGEDGLLGFTDRECRLCFALALWNGQDSILKERLFGLTNTEGNHGEDVKENYYYLEAAPTYSYAKALYKYPQTAFPYEQLIRQNRARGQLELEYELQDTGVFADGAYFDVFVEYAKNAPDDLFIRITVLNRSARPAPLTLLPTLWFRNDWTWGSAHEAAKTKPGLRLAEPGKILAEHPTLGPMQLTFPPALNAIFTENETNLARIYKQPNTSLFVKDAFHRFIVQGEESAVNPAQNGTKCAVILAQNLAGGGQTELVLRLRNAAATEDQTAAEQVFADRARESTEFLDSVYGDQPAGEREIARQAAGGLFWSKQYYHYVVADWLRGDGNEPPPPAQRLTGRNVQWMNVYARDVISMPDKWEYPWFAVWDLAFHCIAFSKLDAEFAKSQLTLVLREWYMHPDGQLPAYEYEFSDVNPPVHAWAAWRVYKMAAARGERDYAFLESCFHKLLLNFTWWVNRKDTEGNNIFSGGFLGLDNIEVFDRSKPLPTGGYLQQADGTAWMGFYCLTMLSIALELAQRNSVYEDLASKFFEHFIAICDSINSLGGGGLWDEEDGFFYDQLKLDGKTIPLKTRSLVGLLPLIAVELLEQAKVDKLPGFKKRMNWFLENRPDLAKLIGMRDCGDAHYLLLAIPSRRRLESIFRYLFDEAEFISPFGLRSLSRVHESKPYSYWISGQDYSVRYTPGEGDSRAFGGNSNWRGPIWMPTNFLLLEALQRYDKFYGDDFKVEVPVGSGQQRTLKEAAAELRRRLLSLFLPDASGRRPCHGTFRLYQDDPAWKDLILFYEYFHADTGRGCGASHQTGWTALILNFLLKSEG